MQEYALRILMVAESHAKSEDFVDRLKLAYITHDPNLTGRLFGWDRDKEEDMTEQEFDEAMAADGAVVEYDLDPISPEEAERILAEIMADPTGVVEG